VTFEDNPCIRAIERNQGVSTPISHAEVQVFRMAIEQIGGSPSAIKSKPF
jgi:hypothetical protein